MEQQPLDHVHVTNQAQQTTPYGALNSFPCTDTGSRSELVNQCFMTFTWIAMPRALRSTLVQDDFKTSRKSQGASRNGKESRSAGCSFCRFAFCSLYLASTPDGGASNPSSVLVFMACGGVENASDTNNRHP
jgi:hypothetical protein